MSFVEDVETEKLISKLAAELEKKTEMKPPNWTNFVKTGTHKERVPEQENWWYIRSASVLRKLYLKQNVGVGEFRKIYGGKKNRGHKPEHKYKASGSIIRKILQQLETIELVKKDKKGRVITPSGQKILSNVIKEIKSNK